MAFTKRVTGFVREEKNVACSDASRRRSFCSSKRAEARASMPNARTSFCSPTISSRYAVCCPRRRDCAVKSVFVRPVMNFAANSDSGVSSTTTSAMRQLRRSMMTSVQRMVKAPVKNCEKPSTRPSESWSASAMMRLSVSPDGCASRYDSGSRWSFANA